jgi:hypothetical protein
MEFMYAKAIQKQEKKQEPATEKQIRFLEMIARNVGLRINTNNITKDKARKVIDQLKLLDKSMNSGSTTRELEQKKREHDIKLGMAKKLVYQRWVAECRIIHEKTEDNFIKEVIYINNVLNKIDRDVSSKQAA